jgi:2-methylcitrate dehydratase PrpD
LESTTRRNALFEKLVANVVETRFENLDRDAVVHAKNRIIDVIGCLIGGANAPGNAELINMVRDCGGKEEATMLIHGGKAPVQNAALVNSIMDRSFDFEPVSPAVGDKTAGGHLSGSTVMTALTVGESTGVDGKELLTALLVGDDIASRILVSGSVNPSSQNKWAMWPSTGTVNMFGTAAIAGRLMGLNHKQMKYALGIALDQTGGSFEMIWGGTTAFKMTQGISARNGIFSAQLAKAGWTGPDDILFSEFGYYNMFAEGYCNEELLIKNLGEKYYSDGTIKPYPCCRMNHPAIDCALALVTKYDIDARDIKEVIIYVSPVAMGHICSQPFRIGEFPQANAAFSFQYTVGTALLRKSVKPEHFTEEAIRGSEINAFVSRIKIAEQGEAAREGVELKAVMKDGREITESTRIARGDQRGNPLSKDEILAKFWNNVDFSRTVSRENAGEILARLEKLEELDSVEKIVELLVA